MIAVPAEAAKCVAQSGERTTALVELYTSEGCSSCPPADRWLSGLGPRGYVPGRVVPLSLHVDYWDYIGWKDRFAKGEFSSRQRKLSQQQRLAFVYTPQVMLQGQDFRAWSGPAFDRAVERINAQPAKAKLGLEIVSLARDSMVVETHAALDARYEGADAALYVAAYENKLASEVTAGENRGEQLRHDYVVLEWQGPFDLARGAALAQRRTLPLLPKAVPAHSGVAAFVQNRGTGEVLQALMLPACAG
ncbi:MAG TPA: DUF1223 domain-containing protein [Burkholderiales bacterium]|nr:DUF1223 domain-containing protein [Gemmatimonadales bacterium]